jgi:hypothetical protein
MTSTDDTYNGYTNRETWAVALYIDNDQGWQEQINEALTEAPFTLLPDLYPASDWSDEECQTHLHRQAGALIKNNVEGLLNAAEYRQEYGEKQPEELAVIANDIGSLWRVNWDELGAAFLSDITEG